MYHPFGGYYSTRRGAGLNEDFITSPEMGTLFAQVFSRAIDTWWKLLGKPEPFYVIEVGAGVGTMARNIAASVSDVGNALRYLAIERSNLMSNVSEIPPSISMSTTLPENSMVGVIFANELLDNLAVDVFEMRHGRWNELKIALGPDDVFQEVLVPVKDKAIYQMLIKFAPNPPDGARVPLQHEARKWIITCEKLLTRGKIVCVDYAHTTSWMVNRPWEEWLRTYRSHAPGTHPLLNPGLQDITCEVAIDQLNDGKPLSANNSQADFLRKYGIEEFISQAQDKWLRNRANLTLEALKAKSLMFEAQALLDPEGLGGYRVMEWDVGL